MNPYIAGAQLLTGGISAISGLFQKARANRLEKQNVRPVYNIPQEIKANQQIAQQQATMGMPGAQYAQGLRNIYRNATNAIAASQDRRGGLSAIGAIQQSSNDAGLNLTSMDAQQRVSNIRNAMAQNQLYAQYRDKAFDWNQRAKYEENAAAIRALRGSGNANINTGLNSIIGAGVTMGSEGGFGGGAAAPMGVSYPSPNMIQGYQQYRNRGY